MSEKHDFEGALFWLDKKEAIALGKKENKAFQSPFRQHVVDEELRQIKVIRAALRLAAALENIDERETESLREDQMVRYTKEFLEQLKKEIDNDQR